MVKFVILFQDKSIFFKKYNEFKKFNSFISCPIKDNSKILLK